MKITKTYTLSEVNEKILTGLMGFQRINNQWIKQNGNTTSTLVECPDYSGDMKVAKTVIFEMQSRGWDYISEDEVKAYGNPPTVFKKATFKKMGEPDAIEEHPNEAPAICLAVLKALGIEI